MKLISNSLWFAVEGESTPLLSASKMQERKCAYETFVIIKSRMLIVPKMMKSKTGREIKKEMNNYPNPATRVEVYPVLNITTTIFIVSNSFMPAIIK